MLYGCDLSLNKVTWDVEAKRVLDCITVVPLLPCTSLARTSAGDVVCASAQKNAVYLLSASCLGQRKKLLARNGATRVPTVMRPHTVTVDAHDNAWILDFVGILVIHVPSRRWFRLDLSSVHGDGERMEYRALTSDRDGRVYVLTQKWDVLVLSFSHRADLHVVRPIDGKCNVRNKKWKLPDR